MSAATATLYGAFIAGGFALLGVVVGLFGERWVRRLSRVRCETHWRVQRTSFRPDEALVLERRLDILFLNRQDVDVTVLEMRVEFCKQGKPFDEEWAPTVEFVDEHDEAPQSGQPPLSQTRPIDDKGGLREG